MKVITRGVIAIMLVVLCLTACGNNDDNNNGTGGNGSGSTGSGTRTGSGTGTGTPPTTTWTPPPTPTLPRQPQRATYQVPDEDCPSNYGHGLDIMTETPAELDYVDKIVACVNDLGTATYLRNESDAVWVLHNNGKTTAGVNHWSPTLDITSFRNVFTTRALLPPKDVITTSIPTADLEWTIDLPLSLSWEAHALVVAKIASLGKTALVDALKGRTTAGAAIAQCTFTMNELAERTSDLADKDMSDLLLDGLGAGVAVNKCRERAAEVRVYDSSNRPIALSEDLAELKGQTKVLETAESRLSTAKLGARVLKWIHFLPRVP